MEFFAAHGCRVSLQFQFAGNHLLGEVSLADEIRHHIDLLAIGQVPCFAERRFLFPENAVNLGEEIPAANFGRVFEIGNG